MKGDFSAVRFDPARHFSRVLLQQGRVMLDDDANEQSAAILHHVRSLAADLIGPHGGPPEGFAIAPVGGNNGLTDLEIASGHYYVAGRLCENELALRYTQQPDLPLEEDETQLGNGPLLVYLDVWERYVSALEDDAILEVALGGPDTAGRARTIWQVRVAAVKTGDEPACDAIEPSWADLVEQWQPSHRGRLRAGTADVSGDPDPCVVAPIARYRRTENQLYRVEVHRGGERFNGVPADEEGSNAATCALLKWSRDNGSVAFAIREFQGAVVTLESLGRDERTDLRRGDLVEVEYAPRVLRPDLEPLPLLVVDEVDRASKRVTLTGDFSRVTDALRDSATLLRRWEGTAPIAEGADWIALEDGVQVQFEPAPAENDNSYRSGDHWQIPARTATGSVIWPEVDGAPAWRPPAGVDHCFAPLAIVWIDGGETRVVHCRRELKPLWD